MMTPAALSAAIDDALAPFGVRCNELPATPERIVNWIEEGRSRQPKLTQEIPPPCG